MAAEAYWSHVDRCWFVPVASELLSSAELRSVEPVRVELRDRQLWITRLEPEAAGPPRPHGSD